MGRTLRLNRPVIAITGSAGKSTTKEMVASILSTRWRIFKSVDNLNFFTHTQQYARKIQSFHRAAVLEYGMSGPGQIQKHCQAIEPNYAIITNIGTAHIGAFGGDVRRLARAKSELIRWMKPTGTVVLNQDDENTRLIDKGRFRGTIRTVGIRQEADYRAHNIRYTGPGMVFDVVLRGKRQHFFIPIHGRHHVYNALSAIAMADTLGFQPGEIRLGLRQYTRMKRRTSVYRYGRNIVVIDDSYSSNPQAAKAAIDTLMHVGTGTKIAVLGSMLALGKHGVQGHAEVGRHAASAGVSRLYTFGLFAKRIGTSAVQAGLPATSVMHFANKAALNRHLLQQLKPNTTILVKGSHAVGLMETADLLRKHLGSKQVVRRTKPS